MSNSLNLSGMISWTFGILVATVGVMNIARGNDPLLGMAYLAASFVFYPPVRDLVQRKTGIRIHSILLVLFALVLVYISLAVGAIAEGYYF